MNINEHIQKELLNEYGGSEKKKTILLDDGNKYMLKLPDPTRRSILDISYINNTLSEHLGSSIYNLCGIPAQKTILGTYSYNGKEKLACLCEDFQTNSYRLREIDKIINSFDLDHATDKSITFQQIDEIITQVDPDNRLLLSDRYYDMFVIDALIGNTDRHNGNWGILVNDITGDLKLSPVYDCGSSFSPLVEDSELSKQTNSHMSYTSAISYNGKKLCYSEFLPNCDVEKVNTAVKRILPQIDMPKIHALIDSLDFISDIRRTYYHSFVSTRYDKILIPALQHSFNFQIQSSSENLNYAKLYHNFIEPFKNLEPFKKIQIDPKCLQDGKILHCMRVSGKDIIFMSNASCIGLINTGSKHQQIFNAISTMKSLGFDIPLQEQHQVISKSDHERSLNHDLSL